MAAPHSDYRPGSMDITEQKRTFHAFLGLTKWSSLVIAVLVLYLSLQFATGAGFLGSVAVSIVVLVVGIMLLREKKSPRGH